ncbi:MAG: hypothetical protein PVH52_04760, partial [bacterium]
MRRFVVAALVLALSLTVISCGGKDMVWDQDIEQSTFTEIEQGMPAAREALADLGETLEKLPRRDRE